MLMLMAHGIRWFVQPLTAKGQEITGKGLSQAPRTSRDAGSAVRRVPMTCSFSFQRNSIDGAGHGHNWK